MSRRCGLLAAVALTVWLCLFLHWDTTEKSMVRALLVETEGDGWTVGLLYQFPEASADSAEAEAAIRLCLGRGAELSTAIAAAEDALPQQADWRLCEYLLTSQDSVPQALSACEELYARQPYGRLASRVFGAAFSLDELDEMAQESEALPEALLQCVKTSAPSAPRLYEQSRGLLLPIVELNEDSAQCQPEALVITAEHTGRLTAQQTEMALLLQGRSRITAGEHQFWANDRAFQLMHPVCGVEKKGETFHLRVDALSREKLPIGAEQELAALCAETISHCGAMGLDISGLGPVDGQKSGALSLTTKNACPAVQADVKIYRFGG